MALVRQLSLTVSRCESPRASKQKQQQRSGCGSSSIIIFSNNRSFFSNLSSPSNKKNKHHTTAVRSCLDTAGLGPTSTATATLGTVTEVNKDTFWPIVHSAADKVVVLDMYTQWCGPCKIIAPKFQELSKQYQDVVFLKLDCNQDSKPLAKELGIRVVPTFKILKGSKIVKEVTGAKLDDLKLAIDNVRSSSS